MTYSRKLPAGFSLVETMVVMAALAIATIGSLGYQHHVANHSYFARCQLTVTRTAQLLLEDWKSTGGSEQYDPTELGLGFDTISIPDEFIYGQGLGTPVKNSLYIITVDGVEMQTMLSWKDVDTDAFSGVTLRQLSVISKWGDNEGVPPVTLTTYVRLDGAGG